MKYIKQDFSLKYSVCNPLVDLGVGQMPKILFQDMFILHIKLKGMKHTITC